MLSTEMIASVNRTSDITGDEIDISERYIRFADHFFLKVSESKKMERLILGHEKKSLQYLF